MLKTQTVMYHTGTTFRQKKMSGVEDTWDCDNPSSVLSCCSCNSNSFPDLTFCHTFWLFYPKKKKNNACIYKMST